MHAISEPLEIHELHSAEDLVTANEKLQAKLQMPGLSNSKVNA